MPMNENHGTTDARNRDKDHLNDLLAKVPDHVLVDLVENFVGGSVETACRGAQICRSWNDALSSSIFWRSKLRSRFGVRPELYHPEFRERFDSTSTASSESGIHPRDVYGATHLLERRFSSGLFGSKERICDDAPITALHMNGSVAVASNSGGSLTVVPTNSSSSFDSLPRVQTGSVISCLAGQSDNQIWSAHQDGSIQLWDIQELSQVANHSVHNSRVSGLVATNEKVLTISSKDGTLRVCDISVESVNIAQNFAPDSTPNSIASVDQNLVMLGCRDNTCRLVDLRIREQGLPVVHLADWCLCVEPCTSNPSHVRASDKAVHLFDLRMLLAPLESRHKGRRLISDFKSDGSLRMVSCGLDGEIKVSSLESLGSAVTSIYSDDDYLLAVDFNRTTLICGGMNGLIEVFSFN